MTETNTTPPAYQYTILSNQYLPKGVVSTYYYIIDSERRIYHYSDGKFRKKALKQMRTFAYPDARFAIAELERLNNVKRLQK